MPHHFREEGSHGQDHEAREGLRINGNGIRDDDFFELGLPESFDSRTGEDGMGGCCVHFFRAAAIQRLLGGDKASCSIDEVIEDDARLPLDLAYHLHDLRDLMIGTALVHDGQLRADHRGEFLGALGTTGIRRDDHMAGEVLLPEVLGEDGEGIQRIDRDGEEPLDLARVQFQRNDVIRTRFLQEMGDELGGDGFAGSSDAILTGVGEMRHDHVDGLGEGELGSLAHQEELNQVFIHRLGSCLEEEDIFAAHGFVEFDVPLSGAESL